MPVVTFQLVHRKSHTVECEKRSSEEYFPSTKKREYPSFDVFGVFALEVKKILQAMPPKMSGEVLMYGNKPNNREIIPKQYIKSKKYQVRVATAAKQWRW